MNSIVNLGNIYSEYGELEQAKILYDSAIEIEEKHFGKNHF